MISEIDDLLHKSEFNSFRWCRYNGLLMSSPKTNIDIDTGYKIINCKLLMMDTINNYISLIFIRIMIRKYETYSDEK